jgi:hypothetical protein
MDSEINYIRRHLMLGTIGIDGKLNSKFNLFDNTIYGCWQNIFKLGLLKRKDLQHFINSDIKAIEYLKDFNNNNTDKELSKYCKYWENLLNNY